MDGGELEDLAELLQGLSRVPPEALDASMDYVAQNNKRGDFLVALKLLVQTDAIPADSSESQMRDGNHVVKDEI